MRFKICAPASSGSRFFMNLLDLINLRRFVICGCDVSVRQSVRFSHVLLSPLAPSDPCCESLDDFVVEELGCAT